MSIDFPVHPRLNEEEEALVQELLQLAPVKRTTLVTGCIAYALAKVRHDGDEFQRLLQMLRRRMQALPAEVPA